MEFRGYVTADDVLDAYSCGLELAYLSKLSAIAVKSVEAVRAAMIKRVRRARDWGTSVT